MDLVFKTFPWAFPQAKKAYEEGFYIETIGICFNSINALLRLALLQKAQLETNTTTLNSYLQDLLMNYENKLTGNSSDRNLYAESKRRQVIDDNLHGNLHLLHEKRNLVFHKLFDGMVINGGNIDTSKLKELANEYLNAYVDCQDACKALAEEQASVGLISEAIVQRPEHLDEMI